MQTSSPATTPEPVVAAVPTNERAGSRWAAMLRVPEYRGRLLRLGLLCGGVGLVAALAHTPLPKNDVEALAAALGEAAHGSVLPHEIRWETSGGALPDAMRGRWVLFLSTAPQDGTRDVWRAKVRVSPEGRPIAIVEAHNLTSTEIDDDHALVTKDSYAAFARKAYGRVQSVRLLDLAGEGAQNKTEALADRAMAYLTNLQQTGSGAGIAKTDVFFDLPAEAVGLALTATTLEIDLAGDGARRHATLDLATGELVGDATGLHVQAAEHRPKKLSHWAVDTARAVPWIGQKPIAWLEENVLSLKDDLKRFTHSVTGGGSTEELKSDARDAPSVVLDTSEASVEAAHWPPPKIPTIWKETEPGEGEWAPPKVSWIRRVPGTDGAAPSPMMITFVRPDDERPYAKVVLVAMDMRQLDIDMEAGSEDPQPLAGPSGPGKLPRDPAIFQRVVACFNGAFKTEHGHYGMMVHKRVLLPPQPGAATVITTRDGRVGLGSWGSNKTVTGVKNVKDDDIVSFRQNLDALVDHGEVNPSGRSLWGYSAPGKGIQTERSGICATTSGHVVYAWGDDVSATTLAKGMKMAGCEYGMHLDMNPFHTGLLFTNIQDVKSKQYKTELLDKGMEIPKERFIEWAPKDFFYVMVHDPVPPALDGASPWKADPGTQPAPSWMPGLWTTRVEGPGGAVEILDVEAGRATWRIRAGTKESPSASPLRELAQEDAKRVLFAVGMGSAPEKRERGFATDGKLAVPLRGGDGWGVLVAKSEGGLAIERAAGGDALLTATGADAAELPIILDDGVVSEGVTGTAIPRAAIGALPDGRVLVARGTFTNDRPLAEALKRAGCSRAVALDRGSHDAPFVHRAGQSTPPRSRYDESVVYAVATPLRPRGFRFEADAAAPQALGSTPSAPKK